MESLPPPPQGGAAGTGPAGDSSLVPPATMMGLVPPLGAPGLVGAESFSASPLPAGAAFAAAPAPSALAAAAAPAVNPSGLRTVAWEEVQHVQGLIEHCMKEYMTQAEIISLLHAKAGIQPSLTCLVWKKLEDQNKDFFYAYNVMLRVKDQMVAFNYLAEQQTRVMQAHNLRLDKPIPSDAAEGAERPSAME